MGTCQTYTPSTQPQLPLSLSHQLQISNAKPKHNKQQKNQQLPIPIDRQPELTENIKKRLLQLAPLSYDKLQKHSRGKLLGPHKFKNGTIYLGEWYNAHPHGTGKYYLPDYSYFEGIIVEGQIGGTYFCEIAFGRIIHQNGDYYEGQFKNGQANGNGTYLQGDITYKGNFKNNLQHGMGIQYNQSYQFKGEFSQGQKKKGTLILKNKSNYQYHGEFKNNNYHGYGILVDDSTRYEGYFCNGLKNGEGKLYDEEGYLQASFNNNQIQGKAKIYDQNCNFIRQELWENGKLIN